MLPSAMASGAAGGPLPQKLTSELQRAQRESARRLKRAESSRQADDAAGVGETAGQPATSDRDVDGRRPWTHPLPTDAETDDSDTGQSDTGQSDTGQSDGGQSDGGQSPEPFDERGQQIDLSG